jgi:hypothetical protein
MRRPIEDVLRLEASPDDAVIVIRGGPITVQKIVGHASRQMELFSYRGEPMVAISADLTVSGWTIERILQDRMPTRSRYATSEAGVLRASGYELLATFHRPHYSIVLPDPTEDAARRLLASFGSTLENPYRQRRR